MDTIWKLLCSKKIKNSIDIEASGRGLSDLSSENIRFIVTIQTISQRKKLMLHA
jgi:hypothetical protein